MTELHDNNTYYTPHVKVYEYSVGCFEYISAVNCVCADTNKVLWTWYGTLKWENVNSAMLESRAKVRELIKEEAD